MKKYQLSLQLLLILITVMDFLSYEVSVLFPFTVNLSFQSCPQVLNFIFLHFFSLSLLHFHSLSRNSSKLMRFLVQMKTFSSCVT